MCKAKRGHNIKNTLKPGARIQEQCKGAKKQNSFLFVLDFFFFFFCGNCFHFEIKATGPAKTASINTDETVSIFSSND